MQIQHTVPKKAELAEVFSLFGEAYRRKYKLPAEHKKVMFAVQACRTSRLGGHKNTCDACGHSRIFYNSCRNRHCPKCQKLDKEKWVEQIRSSLLPMRYFHIVFTIPSELNTICLVNKRVLYNLMFKSASSTLLTLAADKKHAGGKAGMLAVLHTWGQNLMEHPHLHTMVPAGVWDEWNGIWKSSKKDFFISLRVIAALFRGKFLSGLKAAYANGELKFPGKTSPYAVSAAFKKLLDTLYKKDWVVYTKKPFKNSGAIIKYLARYTHSTAISNERIVKIEAHKVLFGYKDYKDNAKRKIMALEGEEFIRRFLLHVLPSGFMRIRYYGLFAMRQRKRDLLKCKKALEIREYRSKFDGLKWHEVLKNISGIDVLLCPCCKKGNMVTEFTFSGKRAPP